MKLLLGLIITCLVLTSCAGLPMPSPADLLQPKGLNVSAQVGKEANKQVIVGDQSHTEVDAEVANVNQTKHEKDVTLSGAVKSVTVNNDVPFCIWFIMILGWVLPTPMQMVRSLLRLRKSKHV